MPDTVREQILMAMETRMEARRGLETYGDTYPVRAMFEGEDEVEKIEYGYTMCAMDLRIEEINEGQGEDKRDWWSQGNDALGQLIKTATGEDTTLDGLCQGISYNGGTVVLPQDGSNTVAAVSDFRIRYRFVNGDPYSKEVE